jgi:subtilisin family serine protease
MQNQSKAAPRGENTLCVWIYLKKDSISSDLFYKAPISQRVQRRLQKVRPAADAIWEDFYPVASIEQAIAEKVLKIRRYSRALLAFSADVSPEKIPELKRLVWVERIEPLGVFYRSREPLQQTAEPLYKTRDYGPTYEQLQQLNIPAVHDSGLTGRGVRIAILDTGFWKRHRVFAMLLQESRLIAEYDFIFNDYNVADETSADSAATINQSEHGTAIWSEIAGYLPGEYIGGAFNAEFLLAKTEREGSETRTEEDNFVAAVEWADQLGADIITTSLGYRDFDNFEYSFPQLDGKTTVTTQIANWAYGRGIVFISSAGNEANNPHFPDGGLGAPADAFGVLAVGAVDANGVRAGFSSYGPTADGRIKPDLCAMGVDTYVASDYNQASYFRRSNGTSFAAPLIASAAALILEKHPHWGPAEVYSELKKSASRADNPDQQYGWGIPDIWRSIFLGEKPVLPPIDVFAGEIRLYPNPSNGVTNIVFAYPVIFNAVLPTASLEIVDLWGKILWRESYPEIGAGSRFWIAWNPFETLGRALPSGMYIVRLLISGEQVALGKMQVVR